ncbi:hypothetical protein [Maribacter antarcticus]|uniref:hypothetical protein n=1 Tax=Maribacter antarcticus TaxID=505250 RepID=UPI000AD17A66|nr:hypothetical protein [Maribacter antarcticus]
MKNLEVNRLKNSDLIKYNTLAALVLAVFLVCTYFMATNESIWVSDSLNTIIKNNYNNLWVYKFAFFFYGCLLYYGSFTKIVLFGMKLAALPELFIVFYGVTYSLHGFFSFEPITDSAALLGKGFETFYVLSNTAHLLLLLSVLFHSILDTGFRTAHFIFFLTAATLFIWTIYNHPNTSIAEPFLYMVQLLWLAVFYNRSKKVETIGIES